MQAGRLRHRLALQRNLPVENDENGFPIPGSGGWQNVALVWAAIEGINGREFIAAAAEQAATTWRITTRYFRLEPSMRLKAGDTVFNVKAILPDNNRHRLVLMCETGVNEG